MLRITSGEFRNRRIQTPDTGKIRPMLEKPRMALFSMLGQDFARDALVIDCFAGTGVLGLEAISRGAAHALFFDTEREHTRALDQLVATLGCKDRCTIRQGDVMRALTPVGFHAPVKVLAKLIFIDPPHALCETQGEEFYAWMGGTAALPCVADDAVAIFGHHRNYDSREEVGGWRRFDLRVYGKVAVSLYERRKA